MTRRIFEFTCGEHTTDKFIDESVRQITCQCGKTAQRKISVPHFQLEGVSGDFPTALQKWEQRHQYKPTHTEDEF